jgi:colanic acid biosynthesis glycosyl transferase WcaI
MTERNHGNSGAGRPRNILILSINYSPEPTGFAPHVTALCEHLARSGYTVTVFTGFPFAPKWSRWSEYRGRFILKEEVNGVSVVRLTHYIPRAPRRIMDRLLMEGTFCLTALWAWITYAPRFEGVIYVGAQPSIALLARAMAASTRVRYGVFINDLATGAAADVGIIKSTFLHRALRAFEFFAYRRAGRAVVLCEAFKAALEADGFPATRVSVVRSPVNLEQIKPAQDGSDFREQHGLQPKDFVIMFAGSMGLKQGMDNVVAAAGEVAPECPQIKWVLVGEGETRGRIESIVRQRGLQETVRLVGFQPADKMSAMFGAADVLLLNQLAAVKNTVVPSKLLTYMAAGRPILAAVNLASQGAEILRAATGGIIVRPESPSELAAGARALALRPAEVLSAMGMANRRYAAEHFDERKIMQQLEEFAGDVVAGE